MAGLALRTGKADRIGQLRRDHRVDVAVFSGALKQTATCFRAPGFDHVGLVLAQDACQVGGAGQIVTMQIQPWRRIAAIVVEAMDPLGDQQRGAALGAAHLSALFEQEFGETGAVLAGDACEEGVLGHWRQTPCRNEGGKRRRRISAARRPAGRCRCGRGWRRRSSCRPSAPSPRSRRSWRRQASGTRSPATG